MVIPLILAAGLVLTNAADVAARLQEFTGPISYELEGTVTCVIEPGTRSVVLTDASGSVWLVDDRPTEGRPFECRTGDVIRVSGRVAPGVSCPTAPFVACERLGRRAVPEPCEVSIADAKAGRCRFAPVRMRAVVRESFRDELDSHFVYLVLDDGTDCAYAVTSATEDDLRFLRTLTGREISFVGCMKRVSSARRQIGQVIMVPSPRAIAVCGSRRSEDFGAPPLDSRLGQSPDRIIAQGQRRVAGRILAVCADNRAVMRDEEGLIHNVRFVEGDLPPTGACVEVVGFAATDLYRVNLTSATWRALPDASEGTNPPPVRVTAAELLQDDSGRGVLKARFHGRTVRLEGTVMELPFAAEEHGRLLLRSGGQSVPVDVAACAEALRDVSVGTLLDVTGCCVVETENWHSYSAFPHATGLVVVPRTPVDLAVLARPPWWTPARLAAVIAILLAVLLALGVWSMVLWAIAVRRGRQVLKAQVERIGSELRIEERTRLAVELHDSISQCLTGVALQVDAAGHWACGDAVRAKRHLDVASRTLSSCREELRNCIWDLRSQVIEEKDMSAAVRRVLEPRLEGVALQVRFNVPRSRLSENAVHAILQIVRELATNAVRHGCATSVRVAGTVDGGRLLFSVADDGKGFDPETRPGIQDGHFGLQGIAERIRPFDGKMKIESADRAGCRVSVSLRMPAGGKEGA